MDTDINKTDGTIMLIPMDIGLMGIADIAFVKDQEGILGWL